MRVLILLSIVLFNPVLSRCTLWCNSSLGYSLNRRKCECEKKSQSDKCLVKTCKTGYEVDENCKCVLESGSFCRIGCPSGEEVHAGNCVCTPIPKCPIKECQKRSELNKKCRCVTDSFPRPSSTSSTCPILKCKRSYELDRKNCKCIGDSRKTCRRNCSEEKSRHSKTKKTKKTKKRCSIERCNHNWKLDRRKCECINRMISSNH